MTTAEAAGRLGVTAERVRQLWRNGDLIGERRSTRLLLDRLSVLDLAERDRPATRPLSVRNAWGLLLMLAGEKCSWLTAPERSRLRSQARSRSEAELARLVRSRVTTLRFDGAGGVGERVQVNERTVLSGASLAHLKTDLVVDGLTEVYAAQEDAQVLAARLRLWQDTRGAIVVHAVPDDVAYVLHGRSQMPSSVVAVDLLESGDPRSRRAGEILWSNTVHEWRQAASNRRAGDRGD